MPSFNQVVMLGRLIRDPDLQYSANGTAVGRFRLAVNQRDGKGDEQRDDVLLIDVVIFGRQAETVSEHLSQGSLVLIDGRLQWRHWETAESDTQYKHEIVAQHVRFLPGGTDAWGTRALRDEPVFAPMDAHALPGDEIPF